MNWQARANGISLGMHFFVTQNAILAARFNVKETTKQAQVILAS
jgi:hypothetical protein